MTNKIDVVTLRRLLTVTQGKDLEEVPWCESSFDSFEELHHTLFDVTNNASTGMIKSKYGVSVDFYHDLVFRNLAEARQAFMSYNSISQSWQTVSYEEVHRLSGALASQWKQSGLEQGQTLVLILSMSRQFVLSLFAALRLGAVVSVIAPNGEDYIKNRLDEAGASFCVSDEQNAETLREWGYEVLSTQVDSLNAIGTRVQSYSYDWDEECMRLFPCWGEESLEPIALGAGEVYTSLIIGQVLAFRLSASDIVSFPGADLQQHMPTSLMQPMLAGATFAELSEAVVCSNPEILEESGVTVVSVTPKLRDGLLQLNPVLSKCRLWLRDVTLPFQWGPWDDFAREFTHPRCFHSNYATHAAAGGIVLFSRWYKENPGLNVLPSPLHKLQLLDVNNSGEPARGENGILSFPQLASSDRKYGNWVVSRFETDFMFGGATQPVKWGKTYVSEEISKLVNNHPLVKHTCVVFSNDSNALNENLVNLIVFMDPRVQLHSISGKLRQEIQGIIMSQFGVSFLPDRIEFSTLFPRRNDDEEIDNAWIRDQFQTGFLARKEKIPVFNLVAQLSSIAENYK